MAVDEAIVIACREGVVPTTIRFYTWDPPCISIGYFQKIDRILNQPQSGNSNLSVVRRITGGRAVIHGNDLSYSVVCNTNNKIFPNNLKGTYDLISDSFNNGLGQLGLHPDTEDCNNPLDSEYQHSTLCFDSTLRHETSFNGKKLIGSAQRRWPDIFLQHGSVILDGISGENGANSTSLNEILIDECDIKEIINTLSAGFCKVLDINLIDTALTTYEINLTEKLLKEKYLLPSWNNKRT